MPDDAWTFWFRRCNVTMQTTTNNNNKQRKMQTTLDDWRSPARRPRVAAGVSGTRGSSRRRVTRAAEPGPDASTVPLRWVRPRIENPWHLQWGVDQVTSVTNSAVIARCASGRPSGIEFLAVRQKHPAHELPLAAAGHPHSGCPALRRAAVPVRGPAGPVGLSRSGSGPALPYPRRAWAGHRLGERHRRCGIRVRLSRRTQHPAGWPRSGLYRHSTS